jgi:lysophospholipase L1-like esterase
MSTTDTPTQRAVSEAAAPDRSDPPDRPGAEDGSSGGPSRWLLLAAGGANVLSVALLGLAVQLESARWFGVIAGAVVALVVAGAVVRRRIDARQLTPKQRRIGLGIGVAVGLAGIGLGWAWIVGSTTDGWGFVGVSTALLGLGHALLQLRSLWRDRPWHGRGVLLASGMLVGVALVALGHGAPGWAGGALLIGVLSAPIGLGLVTESVVGVRARPSTGHDRSGLLAAVGAGLMVAGVAATIVVVGLPARYAIGGAVVLLLLIGAIASKTTTDAILVIGVAALAWAVAPRSEPPTEAMTVGAGERVIVALGDSYMSGEGAERYYAGTNNRRANECRRAPTAYPVRVVRQADAAIPDDVVFLACSGAKAVDIYERAQYPDEPLGGAGDGGGLSQLAQLHALREQAGVRIDLVLVSVGGNDAGFGTVAQTCVAPGDCSELADQWLDALDAVGPTVAKAYTAIRQEVGPDVPVVVVTYPIPLDDDGCGASALTSREHRFLHDYALRLDEVLEGAAAGAGFHYIGEMVTALGDARLRVCDRATDAGVNFLAANPVEGVVKDRVNPLHWFHNSLHPNERGHRAMADVVTGWIHDHPDLAAAPAPSPDPAVASPEGTSSPPAELRGATRDTGDWALEQTVRFVRRIGVPLLAVAAGAWALWVHLFSVLLRRRQRQPTGA